MTTEGIRVRFEDRIGPIPHAKERTAFAEVLRQNPGRVALLGAIKNGRVAHQYAYCIRRAKQNMHMFHPAGHFQAEVRPMFGTTRIYVRFVGVMKHHPHDTWTNGFSAEEVTDDMLINADAYVGGAIGNCNPQDEELALEYMRERGWIGPKGFLTREGAAQARRAQREWDERP